ncbi:hypothetical protein P4B35_13010 [Pontiellaceae bacterium B12227]|nr:hypothetical protein [Pontiellaceae bacterium B12227]
MNKFMTVGLAAVFAAGFVSAQDGVVMVGQAPSGSEVEATAELALVSAHVWRGQVQNEDFVLQPQFTIAQNGISFNIWGNYNFSDNYVGVDNDLNEIDLSLAYTLPLDLNDISFDIGVISYQFPANGSGGTNAKSTMELFAAAHVLTFQDYVIPSVTFFGDIKEIDGTYVLFDIVAPYQVSEYLSVEGGISTGWGSGSYNKSYWNINGGHKGFNDYNIYGTASYEVLDGLTASLNLTYTGVYGGAIKDGAKATYEASEKFWGGVNLAYDF